MSGLTTQDGRQVWNSSLRGIAPDTDSVVLSDASQSTTSYIRQNSASCMENLHERQRRDQTAVLHQAWLSSWVIDDASLAPVPMRHGRTATKPDRLRTNYGFSSNRTFSAGIVKCATGRIPNVVLGLAYSSSHSKYYYSVPTVGSKQSHSCCCGFSFPGNSRETDLLGRKMGRQYHSATNHPQTGSH